MTPEERASEAIAWIRLHMEDARLSWDDLVADVATAIRKSENEALERAAEAVVQADLPIGWQDAVDAIRALKHPDPS